MKHLPRPQFIRYPLIALLCIAQTMHAQIGYVINEGNNNLISIIDSASNKVTGVVNDPHMLLVNMQYIVVTPDGATAYVAVVVGHPTPSYIAIVDTASNTVTGYVSDPHGYITNPISETLAITPDGTKMYVANASSPQSIAIIDLATNTATGLVTVNAPGAINIPQFVAISPDGTKAYVSYVSPTGISIIDVATDTISAANIPFDVNGSQIAFAPDGSLAYAANPINNEVAVIDAATNTVIHTISDASFAAPYALIISANGSTVYVSNQDLDTVSVIDTASRLVTNIISGFNGIYFLTLSDQNILYVPNNTNAPGGIVYFVNSPVTAPTYSGMVTDVPSPHATFDDPIQVVFFTPQHAFAGCKTKNIFLTQTDLINHLTWAAASPTPAFYRLYRDALFTEFVAQVPGNFTSYDAHDTNGSNETYYLVAVYPGGITTMLGSTTVISNC